MKYFVVIIFIILSFSNVNSQWLLQGSGKREQKDFYVSSSTGSDANDGRTESTPWKTIEKINNESIASGSKVLLKAGDKFWGTGLQCQAGVTYKMYGNGAKPVILTGDTLRSWTIYKSGTSADSVYRYIEDSTVSNLTSKTESYWYFIELPRLSADGKLTAIFDEFDNTGTATITYAVFRGISQTDVGDSVDGTTTSVILPQSGKTRISITTNTVLKKDTLYFLGFHGSATYTNTGPSSSSTENYAYLYVTGKSGETFPQAGEVTGENVVGTNRGGYIGIEITVQGQSSNTVYYAITQSGKAVKGGRILNGEYYWKEVTHRDSVDAYNEVYIDQDSVYSLDTNVIAYVDDGAHMAQNAVIDSIDFKDNYRCIYVPSNVTEFVVKNGTAKNSTYGIYNEGSGYVYRMKFLNDKYGLWNKGTINPTYYCSFAETGLQGGYGLYNSGTINIINYSFSAIRSGVGSQIRNTGTLKLHNTNMKSVDTLISTTVSITSDTNNYSANPLFRHGITTITTLAGWQTTNGDDAGSKAQTVAYANAAGYDLSLTDASYSINAGHNYGYKYDINFATVPQADTVDIGAYESPYNSPTSPSGGINAKEYVYVTNSGSNNWSDRNNSDVGITIETLEANVININDSTAILFKRGEKFNDVYLDFSGLNHCWLDAYGSGDLPDLVQIQALSNISGDWSEVTVDGVQVSKYTFTTGPEYHINRMWLNGQEYMESIKGTSGNTEMDTHFAFGDTYRWRYEEGSTKRILIWTPNSLTANEYYTNIEIDGVKEYVIKFQYSDDVKIQNLRIRGGQRAPLFLEQSCTNFLIKNCELYDGGQGLLYIRSDGSDNNIVEYNDIDSRFDKIYNAPIDYEPSNYHIVDIQWGADSNIVRYNRLIGGGISHIRVIGKNGYGYLKDNLIHHNYIWSINGKARVMQIDNGDNAQLTDRPKDTFFAANYIGNCSFQARPAGVGTKFCFNIIDSLYGRSYKVADHLYQPNESYEVQYKDYAIFPWGGTNQQPTNDFYAFNNTFFRIGSEAFYINQGQGGGFNLWNNLIVNTSERRQSSGNYDDLQIATTGLGYNVKNNYSYNQHRQAADENALYYNSLYQSWADVDGNGVDGDIFLDNYQKDVTLTSYYDIFVDVNNDDFSIKSTRTDIKGQGIDVTSYIPISPFYDIKIQTDSQGRKWVVDGDNRIDNDTIPNIGAIDN